MGENTTIAWCDHTWNPWLGRAGRRRKTSRTYWQKPLKWNKWSGKCPRCYGNGKTWDGITDHDCDVCDCSGEGERLRVFPSLCDVFEDWKGPIVNAKGDRLWMADSEPGRYVQERQWAVLDAQERKNIAGGAFRPATMDDIRRDLFGLIDQTQNLDWLLLTKRPENIQRMWPLFDYVGPGGHVRRTLSDREPNLLGAQEFRDNVSLLYSASDQKTLKAGIDHLLECRSLVPVLGLSLDPLIGPVNLGLESTVSREDWRQRKELLDWVIVGGESGPGARPCDLAWILDIVQQCKAAGVAVWVKQDSGPKPGQQGRIPDDIWAIKELPQIPKVQRG